MPRIYVATLYTAADRQWVVDAPTMADALTSWFDRWIAVEQIGTTPKGNKIVRFTIPDSRTVAEIEQAIRAIGVVSFHLDTGTGGSGGGTGGSGGGANPPIDTDKSKKPGNAPFDTSTLIVAAVVLFGL